MPIGDGAIRGGALTTVCQPRFRLFSTGDLDEARQRVSQVYCDHRLTSATGRVDAFHYRVALPGLSFNYMQYGAETRIEPGYLNDFYLLQLPLKGSAHIQVDGASVESDVNRASVVNYSGYTRMTWSEDCRQFLVQISRERVEQVAARWLGVPLDSPLLFDGAMDRENPRHAAWWRHLAGFVEEYLEEDSFFSRAELLDSELENIVRGLLLSLNHNYADRLEGAAAGVMPRHVKTAIEYANANIGANLSVAELAAAAGVSERCLYEGFRKFAGLSPMRFVQRLRLQRVREGLERARDTETTVTRVATEHGFTQLGRFAAAYRRVYGETPSVTLARRIA